MTDESLQQDRACLALAYKNLLRLSFGGISRHQLQTAMASIRDEIARIDGRDPEQTQIHFETMNMLRRRDIEASNAERNQFTDE